MGSEIVKPRLIAFEVTRRCRYSCRHCRANAGLAESEEELTTGQCKRILGAVGRFAKCIIILTGGEPMERDDIYQIIRHGDKVGLRMVMATCGYLLDDQSVEKLKEAGITALSFSLDGASAESHDKFRQAEGAFETVVKAAEVARRAGVRFQINTTISRINIGEVAGIARLAESLGAYCFNPFILVPTGRAEQMTDTILDPVEYEALLNDLLQMKIKAQIQIRVTCGPQFSRVWRQERMEQLGEDVSGCMGGRGFGFISYRGDVQTCGFLDISAGNLVKNHFNFAKVWQESQFLRQIRDVSSYKGFCRECEYVGVCGGCRARAFGMTGDYLAADPICDYKRKKRQ